MYIYRPDSLSAPVPNLYLKCAYWQFCLGSIGITNWCVPWLPSWHPRLLYLNGHHHYPAAHSTCPPWPFSFSLSPTEPTWTARSAVFTSKMYFQTIHLSPSPLNSGRSRCQHLTPGPLKEPSNWCFPQLRLPSHDSFFNLNSTSQCIVHH